MISFRLSSFSVRFRLLQVESRPSLAVLVIAQTEPMFHILLQAWP
jgi:hypothetical protein